MDYKGKASHVVDTDASLLDELNTFACSEENTEPRMLATATHKYCELSFSEADVSKTLKHVNPCMGA